MSALLLVPLVTGNRFLTITLFLAVVAVTLGITFWASRQSKTAAQYYAAGRSFSGFQNGLAVSGDYMSAASFLGISGSIALYGYDGFLYSIGFMVWYVTYVICNNWARDFMDTKVIGHINVALVFGLLQFVSTFAIAYFYARHANKSLDPLSAKLRDEFEREAGR